MKLSATMALQSLIAGRRAPQRVGSRRIALVLTWARLGVRRASRTVPILALLPTLAACDAPVVPTAPEVRPVRTVVAERRKAGVPITLTGRIQAEDEVSLAFRIAGRILESNVNLGDHVEAGQLVARLESQNELNSLRTARANLAPAQGQLIQAQNQFQRQDTLLKQGWTTRANHDQATQIRD